MMPDRGREEAEKAQIRDGLIAEWLRIVPSVDAKIWEKELRPLAELIATALSRARAAAIEEAAKKSEGLCHDVRLCGHKLVWPCRIAAEIRALSQQEDGK